ncbi:MAG: 30S ribosomal protein S6 [Patescibacteria group bacterium]|nr:30S ribosomal protein S6 [Patescibacteria group bacterium]
MAPETNTKEYEISFVVKTQDGASAVEGLLGQHRMNVLFKSPVTETRLAYPIKKHATAFFGYMHAAGLPEEVSGLVHDANLNPEILRILVVTPPVGKEMPVRSLRGEKSAKKAVPESAAAPVQPAGALTNEALSEKLEEILK